MKEITRIHIAKTPYECETAAKDQLQTYLHALEAHNVEPEIIEDIEIRMTEILLERGVKKGAVITVADVAALKKQLGQPEDFMAEGDIAVGADETGAQSDAARKLYRDGDNAMIGGVLAGIAAFFNVNPMWVRLVFILLALASFGTAILVYAVLWIAVPEAKTAADKLQMRGQPVTLGSIRKVNESESRRPAATGSGRRVALGVLGVFCALGALGAALVTVAALFGGLFFSHHAFSGAGGSFLLAAYVLALVSGLLLTVLFILAAYASFAQKCSRRVLISMGVVTALGLATFGTAAGMAHYGSMREIQQIRENTHEVTVQLPEGAQAATSLVADAPGMTVEYIVTDSRQKPRAQAKLFAKDESRQPNVTTTLKDGVLMIKADAPAGDPCMHAWCDSWTQKITVYGPALANVNAQEDTTLRYHGKTQPALGIDAARDSHVAVESGVIETLHITVRDASVSASDASVSRVNVRSMGAESIELGSVQGLELTDNDACPSGSMTRFNVWNVADDTIKINGATKPAETARFACTRLHINGREDNE